ncbi:CPBP family intramembrane glutamic endopeptidase [Thermoflavimicrobium daqui]|uniref:CPBP family intramembrane metalloprotease n=1 Tax=Thermoflavimicrobium daqui TaxID=2137476 RepID=A0A364K5A8_9BACL|nr:type II CAAX endopeptidase family protein [Thermoflavimicrobium daqui]RAL24542.1 CPBP family intramembrane metalloprotease [Thermoflavimicrobium daqui]
MNQKKGMLDIGIFILVVLGITLVFNLIKAPLFIMLAQAAPMLAVIVMLIFFGNRKETFLKMGVHRLGKIRWYLVAILASVPVILSFLVAWSVGIVDLPTTEHFPAGMTQVGRLFAMIQFYLGFMYLTTPLVFAFAEEIGWRGFLQVRLSEELGEKKAWLYTSMVWVIFHYPFYLNQYNEDGNVWINMVLFTVTILPLGLVMGWVRTKSQSIWPVVLLHMLINHIRSFMTEFFHQKEFGWSYIVGESGLVALVIWSLLAWMIWKNSKTEEKSLKCYIRTSRV